MASSKEEITEPETTTKSTGPRFPERFWFLTTPDTIRQWVNKDQLSYGFLVTKSVGKLAAEPPDIFRQDFPQLIHPLFNDPFPVEEGYTSAGGRTWTWIEVVSRLHLLFITLYHFAEVTAGGRAALAAARKEADDHKNDNTKQQKLHDIQIKVLAKPTYLHHFFDYLRALPDAWTETRIPVDERTILEQNQANIDASVVQHVTHGALLPFMVPPRIQDEWVKTIPVPRYENILKATNEGPVGPVSPEVAFILALQFAGIDLAAMAAQRQEAAAHGIFSTTAAPPPRLYKSATFPQGRDLGNDMLYNRDVVETNYTDPTLTRVYAATRTQRTDRYDVNGVGLNVAMDLLCGLGIDAKQDPDQRRYFNFSMHAADVATHPEVHMFNERLFAPYLHGPLTVVNRPPIKAPIQTPAKTGPVPDSAFATKGPDQELFKQPTSTSTGSKGEVQRTDTPEKRTGFLPRSASKEERKEASPPAKKAEPSPKAGAAIKTSLKEDQKEPALSQKRADIPSKTATSSKTSGKEQARPPTLNAKVSNALLKTDTLGKEEIKSGLKKASPLPQPSSTKGGNKTAGSKAPSGGVVWPHCHQGFWAATHFFQMFGMMPAYADWVYNETDGIKRKYTQVRESHIYLKAETEIIRRSRQTRL